MSVAAPSVAGCSLGDEGCDAHQRVVPGTHHCACLPGFVLSARGYGCEPCAINEEGSTGQCVCRPGFARRAAGDPCEAITGSLAAAGCSATEPCSEPNPYCALSEPAPYCTVSGCTSNDDCPKDWRCPEAAGVRFCRTPPVGLGEPCEGPADCAGKEAAYCETFQANVCLVNDCADDVTRCPSGSVCCDFRGIIGESLCVERRALTNGKCPTGMAPVSP